MKKTNPLQKTAKSGAAGAPPPVINTLKIDVRPFNRTEQSVPKWRNAIRQAESRIPRRVLLYDLYKDVELDTHVEAVWGKRLRPVTNTNWTFVNEDNEPIEAVEQIIDSLGFEDMLREIMNSKTWGYSMMMPRFWKDPFGEYQMDSGFIPRLVYRPHAGIVAHDAYTDEGHNVREGFYARTVMEVGDADDLGLFAKVAPFQILKRGGVGDWAMFVQVFGNPLIDATWNGFDETQRQQLLKALSEMGASGVLVRPEGTTVDLKDKQTNANGELQKNFMMFLNKEISKGLLGTTESVEASQSSGHAQSATHLEQDHETSESDITFVRRVLNSRFRGILQAAGIEIGNGKFDIKSDDEVLSKQDMIDNYLKAKSGGVPINLDEFYEVAGMQAPDPEDIEDPEQEEEDEAPNDTPADPSKPEEDESVKLSSLNRLLSFFGLASANKVEAKTEACCATHTIELAATAEPDYRELFEAVQAAEGEGELYPELFYLNAEALSQGFGDGWQNNEFIELAAEEIGIDYGFDAPAAATAWEMNLFKFSAVKAAFHSREVNELFRRSKSFEEFQALVRQQFGVKNRHHLETEYNTAYQTGQAAATYQRLRNRMNTFPYWMYRTIGDGRVRASHVPLEGVVLPADHPLWNLIFPPNDWNCRCFVVPRLAGEVSEAEVAANVQRVEQFIASSPAWQKALRNGFGMNRANTSEVFTAEQMYSAEPNQTIKRLERLTAADWRLAKMAEIQKARDREFIGTTDPAAIDDFWERNRINGTTMNLTDYANRLIVLERRAMQRMIDRGVADAKYMNIIQEVIRSADETWARPSLNQFTYVKYFRNEAVRVTAKLNSRGDLEIIGWGGELDEAFRKGLPIQHN